MKTRQSLFPHEIPNLFSCKTNYFGITNGFIKNTLVHRPIMKNIEVVQLGVYENMLIQKCSFLAWIGS